MGRKYYFHYIRSDGTTDASSVESQLHTAVPCLSMTKEAAAAAGLMSGMTDDRFAPGDNATHAQIASPIKRLLEK